MSAAARLIKAAAVPSVSPARQGGVGGNPVSAARKVRATRCRDETRPRSGTFPSLRPSMQRPLSSCEADTWVGSCDRRQQKRTDSQLGNSGLCPGRTKGSTGRTSRPWHSLPRAVGRPQTQTDPKVSVVDKLRTLEATLKPPRGHPEAPGRHRRLLAFCTPSLTLRAAWLWGPSLEHLCCHGNGTRGCPTPGGHHLGESEGSPSGLDSTSRQTRASLRTAAQGVRWHLVLHKAERGCAFTSCLFG